MTDSARQAEVRTTAWSYAPRLRRYAASILRDDAAAEDAVQDVMCRLIDGAFATTCDESGLRAQLFTATRHRCIDWLRKEKRMTALAELDGLATPPTTRPSDDPVMRLVAIDETETALAALDRLPTLQRDALRLRFSGGLSYKQIAEAMGKSVSHVGVLIHEGLATLRTQLVSDGRKSTR